MVFFLSVSSRKVGLAVIITLLFSNLSASDKEADTKNEEDGDKQERAEETTTEKESDNNTDQLEDLIDETTNGNETEIKKGEKQDMEETVNENETEINKEGKQDTVQEAIKEAKIDDIVQEVNEETTSVTIEPTEDTRDSIQEVTEETPTENLEPTEETEKGISQEMTEVTATETADINEENDDRIQELTEEEIEAVMKNCSMANLDDGSGSSRPEVPTFHCRVALWFQGEFPEWIKTFNFVKDVESLSEEGLDKAAEAVCDCKIIDISDFCRIKVRETAQKIIDRCPRNTIITRLFKQTQSYFRQDANLYYV